MKPAKFRSLLLVLLMGASLGPSVVSAQIYDPVEWHLSFDVAEAPPGSTVVGRLKAEIEDTWHVYSTTTSEGIPLDVFVVDSVGIQDWQVYQPEPEVVFDPNFQAEVEWYTGQVELLVALDLAEEVSGDLEVEVRVRYGACDPRQCLPPKRKSATATVGISPAAPPAAAAIPEGYQPASLTGLAGGGPALVAETGSGADPAPDFGAGDRGLVGFSLLALGVGFLAILTPCVFPMIPIYMGSFLGGGTRSWGAVLRQAGVFCAGVIILFTALGGALGVFAGPFGLAQIGSNPWVNLLIALIMFLFALSMLGAFELTMPSSWTTGASTRSAGSGVIPTLMLSLVFTLASFACTGPFMGSLLAGSFTSGGAAFPAVGMAMFATGLSAPFFLLALFPPLMNRLPRSGGWLATSKRTAGLVIVAVGLKYLGNADQVFGWAILTRERFLAVWMVLFAAAALYLWGILRFRDDGPVEGIGLVRLGVGTLFLALAVSLVPGMFGGRLGELDAHVPGDPDPAFAGGGDSGLQWIKDDYDGAVLRARSENATLFVSFTGYACSNCKWMKSNMFTRPEVASLLGEMTLVELYTDGVDEASERHQALQVERFRSSSIPFYALIRPNGTTAATFSGQTRDTDEFLQFLESAS